jgi:catechol 2,3-dioxygenase-like lactoylglutathione lyase family enzyme
MSRVQLALNVTNVDAAVEFYRRLFGTEPAKRRPGYANFAIASPPLKLVLIENPNAPVGTLNHLGVEVESSAEVDKEAARLRGAGFALRDEEGVTCCHAVQDKVWVDDPQGTWEFYTVLADAPPPPAKASACCGA